MKIKFSNDSEVSGKAVPVKVQRRRWDRWVYLGILILLVLSFIRWLTTPWFFDSAQGILLQQQYDVHFAYDIRVLEYKVSEDEKVKAGDTLFFYEKYKEELSNSSYKQDSIQLVLKQNAARTSIIALESQIEKKRLFLIDLKKRLEYWKSERERKEKLVYLNVITPNELANVDRLIDDVSYSIASTDTEYRVLIQERQHLLKSLDSGDSLGQKGIGLAHQKAAFVAPVEGRIDRLRIQEQQICYKEDVVTSVINPGYFVRAYIEMSDLDNFKKGDDVVVFLPYGYKKLAGKVRKIYSVSELKENIVFENNLNEKKYGIVVEIIPADAKGWNEVTVSNIPVKVRKGKIKI